MSAQRIRYRVYRITLTLPVSVAVPVPVPISISARTAAPADAATEQSVIKLRRNKLLVDGGGGVGGGRWAMEGERVSVRARQKCVDYAGTLMAKKQNEMQIPCNTCKLY